MAVKAYVLIDVMVGKNEEILKAIAGMEGVKSIHAVTGPHDLIALVEGEDLKGMGDIVLSRIRGVKGVIKTLTCMVIDIQS